MVLPEGMEFEDFTPLRHEAMYSPIKDITHFNYHFLQNTILKLDVLGLLALEMFSLLEKFTGISMQGVPWNDPKSYALFTHADTLGIPEFGPGFTQHLLEKINRNSCNLCEFRIF